jgi:hypothetical protein
MTTQQLTANFSVNDIAYFVIFATANLYAVKITNVYLKTIDSQSTVMYDLLRLDKNFIIQAIPQNQVLTFTEAKTSLINYLQTQLSIVNNLTA